MPENRPDEPRVNSRLPEDPEDWRELAAGVLRLVRMQLGDKLRRRVESMDIVQDVLHDVVRDQDKFSGDQSVDFRNWVSSIVRHRVCNLADFHQRQKRDLGRDESVGGEQVDRATGPDVVDELQAREDQQRLFVSLSEIDEEDRTLILMRDFEQLAWPDVARLANKPSPDAARVAYARAITRLTRRFEGQKGDP